MEARARHLPRRRFPRQSATPPVGHSTPRALARHTEVQGREGPLRQVPPEGAGEHHEETVTHEVNDCPEARKVWAGIAKAWEAATGEPLDTTTPRLTAFAQNLGPPRRSKPATGTRPPSPPGACCTP